MRRKVLRAALVVVLATGATAYASLEKSVVVNVEGRPVAVRTFAFSVGDALRRAGISIGPADRVEPAVSADLRDGLVIRVFRAKPITILLDGKPRRVIVTSLTVDDVLSEINVRGSLADSVRPSRSARVEGGMTITYRRAVAVRVAHDGKTERVITNAATVGRVLAELGVERGPKDKVRPGLGVAPSAGMVIRVLRVGVRVEQVEQTIAFDTTRRRDARLEYGLRRTAQAGRPGLRVLRYRSVYVDGIRVSRRLLGSKVARPARDRVISIGAHFPRCRCDRGSQSGTASWYGASGLTAAHRTLPMGTVVRVRNLANGRTVTVVIRDRGPYGKGRIIDLSDAAFARLAPLGKGLIRVEIEW